MNVFIVSGGHCTQRKLTFEFTEFKHLVSVYYSGLLNASRDAACISVLTKIIEATACSLFGTPSIPELVSYPANANVVEDKLVDSVESEFEEALLQQFERQICKQLVYEVIATWPDGNKISQVLLVSFENTQYALGICQAGISKCIATMDHHHSGNRAYLSNLVSSLLKVIFKGHVPLSAGEALNSLENVKLTIFTKGTMALEGQDPTGQD